MPPSLADIHDEFHVPQWWKCVHDLSHVMRLLIFNQNWLMKSYPCKCWIARNTKLRLKLSSVRKFCGEIMVLKKPHGCLNNKCRSDFLICSCKPMYSCLSYHFYSMVSSKVHTCICVLSKMHACICGKWLRIWGTKDKIK